MSRPSKGGYCILDFTCKRSAYTTRRCYDCTDKNKCPRRGLNDPSRCGCVADFPGAGGAIADEIMENKVARQREARKA